MVIFCPMGLAESTRIGHNYKKETDLIQCNLISQNVMQRCKKNKIDLEQQ